MRSPTSPSAVGLVGDHVARAAGVLGRRRLTEHRDAEVMAPSDLRSSCCIARNCLGGCRLRLRAGRRCAVSSSRSVTTRRRSRRPRDELPTEKSAEPCGLRRSADVPRACRVQRAVPRQRRRSASATTADRPADDRLGAAPTSSATVDCSTGRRRLVSVTLPPASARRIR